MTPRAGRSLTYLLTALTLACASDPSGPEPGLGAAGSSAAGGRANGGESNDAGASGSSGGGVSFTCDESAKPPPASLRRLTMSQYRHTLSDFLAFAMGSADAGADVMQALSPRLERLPTDRREPTAEDLHGSYRRLDQSLQQLHVDSLYDVGVAAAALLTQPGRLEGVAGTCATDDDASNDAACVTSFVQKLGTRALRRPLEPDEQSFYESVYGADKTASAAAYADVIATLLNAPQMIYFVEHGAAEVPGKTGVFELTAHELASRLSYQLWQTAPDAQLLAHAEDGSLLDPRTYRDEVERLLADTRARPALDEFFADWAKVEDLPALDAKNRDPIFAAFAGDALPSPGLRQAMIDDVLSLLGHYTWQERSGVAAIFESELSFARSPELAAIYGVAAWDGVHAPPRLPAGERPGLLTRALFLASGSPNTRPIMKGLFIRKHVLCDAIPPPPPGANAKPPELEPGMTTRETVEELTQTPGTVCAGCHTTLINPLGFATESFDALGRYRTEQRFFATDGSPSGEKPIDTRSVPQVIAGDQATASGAGELMQQIVASGKVEACLSRSFFRYTFGRWEDSALDGCALQNLKKTLAEGGSLVDLVAAAALDASFKQRAFE